MKRKKEREKENRTHSQTYFFELQYCSWMPSGASCWSLWKEVLMKLMLSAPSTSTAFLNVSLSGSEEIIPNNRWESSIMLHVCLVKPSNWIAVLIRLRASYNERKWVFVQILLTGCCAVWCDCECRKNCRCYMAILCEYRRGWDVRDVLDGHGWNRNVLWWEIEFGWYQLERQ